MKTIIGLICTLAFGATVWSQPIPKEELIGPNNSIRDAVYGISVTLPAGWEVRSAVRWGKNNKENTIFLKPMWPLVATPSLYYQPRSNFDSPAPDKVEAHFRYTAGTKAQQRINSGLSDYRNIEETFEPTQINGRPGFRYMASYTRNGKIYLEYFIRVLGDTMMAMFFVQAPADEMDIVRREVDQMAATIHVP
jgi:hypothetical protein